MSVELTAVPLSAEAFRPYGDVIDTVDAVSFGINEGTTMRFDDLATIDADADDGRPAVSIFRAAARTFPFDIEMVERHPLGSQAFVPLDRGTFVVVVAPAGEAPSADDLVAFIARGGQGINLAPGVWHHPLLATENDSDFLVIDRIGPGANCDIAEVTAVLHSPT